MQLEGCEEKLSRRKENDPSKHLRSINRHIKTPVNLKQLKTGQSFIIIGRGCNL